jgi:hypothetical protein
MGSDTAAIQQIAIDRAIYAVDRVTRTYRYAARNPGWSRLDPVENEHNKRSIDGFVRIFPDGSRKTFRYRPPYTTPPSRHGR